MKFFDIFQTASNNMFRNKVRTVLTIIAIFIGAMTLTLTNGIGSGIASYIDEQLGHLGAEDALLIQRKADENPTEGPQKYEEGVSFTSAGGFSMPVLTQNDLKIIKSQTGIKSAEFNISAAPDYIQGPNDEKYKLNPNSFIDGLQLAIAAGKSPTNNTDEYQIAMPKLYAPALGFASDQAAIGQQVTLGVKTPKGVRRLVTGHVVAVQEQTLVGATGVIVNRPLAKAIYDIQTEGATANEKDKHPLAVARFDRSISDEQLKSIKEGLDKKGFVATTIQDQIGLFKQVIDAVIMVLNFFAGIALLAASFGIVNTLLMAVQERTKEIGLMKAMGMRSRKVFLLFSVEAILIGFWGSLLGSLAGIGIGKAANHYATKTFLKDLIGFELTSFPWESVAVIMLIIMVIAFVAGTLPARRAAKQSPIDALRYE